MYISADMKISMEMIDVSRERYTLTVGNGKSNVVLR